MQDVFQLLDAVYFVAVARTGIGQREGGGDGSLNDEASAGIVVRGSLVFLFVYLPRVRPGLGRNGSPPESPLPPPVAQVVLAVSELVHMRTFLDFGF